MTIETDDGGVPHPERLGRVHSLGNAAAVELASAWVSHRARSLGIRVLLVKGPLAGRLGLRAERVSSDADVLVEPGRLHELTVHLSEYGWHERPVSTVPRIVELHSAAMIHDDWPIDIDVHSFWPGFIGDPVAVFESLWRDRLEVTLAGVAVTAPDLRAGILILALHSLRKPLGPGQHRVDTLQTLRQSALATLAEPVGERLLERAGELGAVQTAAPLLRLFGLHIEPDSQPSEELRLWHLKAQTNGNVGAWLLEVRNAHGRARLRAIQRALLPGSRDLRRQHPELPSGPHGLALGWLKRWRSGIVELPRTLGTVRRLRPGRGRASG